MFVLAAALAMALASPAVPAQRTQPAPLIGGAIWMGDSIAYDLAPGVETALSLAGLDVSTFAFPGISLTGGAWLPRGQTWLADHIPVALEHSGADVVIWQLSRFDAPMTHDANVLAYTAFVDLALRGRSAVVFVTAPPIDPAAVPAGWPEDWGDLNHVAHSVAANYPGRVFVVDSTPAWGRVFVELADDGTPLRKPDGVHVCPLGATIFGDFLVRWLDDHFSGVAPVDPSAWPLDWWFDGRYYLPPTCARRRNGSCGRVLPRVRHRATKYLAWGW